MNSEPAPTDPDLAVRLAWRLAVADLLRLAKVQAEEARKTLEVLRSFTIKNTPTRTVTPS